jgi:NTE family protein
LVLGAGGVMGGAWLTGALAALAAETRWDPRSAARIVGTSAGAMMGALVAAGVPPWFMVAHSAGEVFEGVTDASGRPAAEAERDAGASFRLHRGLPPIGPGSWRLALTTLTRPADFPVAARLSGWLPRGVVSTEPLKDTVRRVVPSGWAEHPSLWLVACDYRTGERVVFGRGDDPRAELADAVAASCAIPGFYHPVVIAGRRYVDGGMWSASNLDLLRGCGLDLVICLNPTSSLDRSSPRRPIDRVAGAFRSVSGRRLGREARELRSEGVEAVLVQPVAEDLEAMGRNWMSGRRRHRVIETAMRTVAQQLREPEKSEPLAGLPEGEPYMVERPPGPPSEWPRLRDITQAERRAS